MKAKHIALFSLKRKALECASGFRNGTRSISRPPCLALSDRRRIYECPFFATSAMSTCSDHLLFGLFSGSLFPSRHEHGVEFFSDRWPFARFITRSPPFVVNCVFALCQFSLFFLLFCSPDVRYKHVSIRLETTQ
jgi:hypothetical protein